MQHVIANSLENRFRVLSSEVSAVQRTGDINELMRLTTESERLLADLRKRIQGNNASKRNYQ